MLAMSWGNRLFYLLTRGFFAVLLKIYNRITVRWTESLPDRNVILIANHCSNLDPIILGSFFPRQLRYLAKSELFESKLFGAVIRALGAVPVEKQDSQSAGASLRGFLKLLEDGSDVLLFPEGGRSTDGMLQPLEGGAALIAMKSGAPVLPAFLSGTFEAMPMGSSMVRPVHISVIFGRIIDSAEYAALGRPGREKLLEAMQQALADLEKEHSSGRGS